MLNAWETLKRSQMAVGFLLSLFGWLIGWLVGWLIDFVLVCFGLFCFVFSSVDPGT